jgi:hypothetical protein
MRPHNNICRFKVGEEILSRRLSWKITITKTDPRGSIIIWFTYRSTIDDKSHGGGNMPLKEFKEMLGLWT